MNPTAEQLKGMARHVEYEIGEFRNSIRVFADLKKQPQTPSSEKNRALESILLHFRILRGFFFGEPGPNRDDVFARHYCDRLWKPVHDAAFRDTKENLNKRVAHLTLRRLEGDENWKLDAMSKAIEANIGHFANSIGDRLAWFPALKRPISTVILGVANNSTASVGTIPMFGDLGDS